MILQALSKLHISTFQFKHSGKGKRQNAKGKGARVNDDGEGL